MLAISIMNKVMEIPALTGRKPNTLVSAVIYVAAEKKGEQRSAKEISKKHVKNEMKI